jgi:hypothetical protein
MFGNRTQRRLESALTDAVHVLGQQIGSRATNEREGQFLSAIVWTQAETFLDFALDQRRDKTIRGLVDAATEPEHRALRVASWALAARIPGSALAQRYPATDRVAERLLGIENEWEERIASYEPTSSVRESLEHPFDRLCVGGMIAVTTAITDPQPSDAALIDWNARSVGAFVALRAQLDEVHPQPGMKRLSEVEAEIKARRSQ